MPLLAQRTPLSLLACCYGVKVRSFGVPVILCNRTPGGGQPAEDFEGLQIGSLYRAVARSNLFPSLHTFRIIASM